jgi:thiamine biosynthesis lipoprotein
MLEQADWRALGTNAHLFVLDGDLGAARARVDRVIEDVDAAYSRFRRDSDLMRLQAAAGQWTPVSRLLWDAISVALRAARDTDGAVDPTIGRAMRIVGYDDDFANLARRGVAADGPVIHVELAPVPGWRAIGLDAQTRSVRVPARVELDFGSTGKALASDLAAAAAYAAAPGGGVLVSLGGDIATAGRTPEGGWRILASEDSETAADSAGEVVAIAGGAVATSSTTVRRWRSGDGIVRHHLIDPWTGGPVVSRWRTVSVVADTCVAANTAATATIVLGERGLSWLEARALPARLVDEDGRVTRIGGWPEPEMTSGAAPERFADAPARSAAAAAPLSVSAATSRR